jgi:hypothetical protein
LNNKQAETQAVVAKLDAGVNGWRPQVESAIHDLRAEVGDLCQQLDLVGKMNQASSSALSPRVPSTDEERKAPLLPTPPPTSQPVAAEERKAPLLPTPPPTSQPVMAEGGSKWANGHHSATQLRGRVPGVHLTQNLAPGKGTFDSNLTHKGNFNFVHKFEGASWGTEEFDFE